MIDVENSVRDRHKTSQTSAQTVGDQMGGVSCPAGQGGNFWQTVLEHDQDC